MMEESAGASSVRRYGQYTLIPVLILAVGYILLYLAYGDVKREIIEELNARQMIHAKQAAKGIEDFFGEHIEILRNLSRNEHIIFLDEAGKSMMYELLSSHQEEMSVISREDGQGRILYAEPHDPAVIGQLVTRMEDFEEAKRSNRAVVSDVFTNRRGFKSIILHVPVWGEGHFDGTLAMLLRFDVIAKRYIADIQIGKDGYAWVIGSDGIEISCPVPGHVGNSVLDNCRDYPDIIAMAERMIRGEQGTATYTFDRLRENIVSRVTKCAVFMPIRLGDNFWSIVVATPEDEATDTLQGFRNKLLLIAMLLICGMGVFLYLMFRGRLVVQKMEQAEKEEEALRESQERLNLALKSSKAGAWDRDIGADKATWDEHLHALFGRLPGTFSGGLEDFLGMLHPDDRERVRGEMSAAIDGEADYATTFRVVWPDSSVHYLADRGRVYRDGDGRAVRMIGVNLDITELKLAEESLRQSERKFHSIFDAMSEIVVLHELICDPTGRPVDYRILDCNPEFTHSTGIRAERAVGALASQLYGTGEPPYLESYAPVALTGKPIRFEVYFTPLQRHFNISVVSPGPGRFATVSIDITQRVEKEREIRLLNRLYSVISQVSEAVVHATHPEDFLLETCRVIVEEGGFLLSWIGQVDPETKAVVPVAIRGKISDYARGITVYADERPEGRGPTGTCIRERRPSVHNDFLHSPLTKPWRERAQPYGIRAAAAFPIESGGRVWGALSIYSDEIDFFGVEDVKLLEKVAGDIGFALDNFERERQRRLAQQESKRLEVQLRQAQKMEAIGTLAGGIAHDFNNILGIIMGYVELHRSMSSEESKDNRSLDEALKACGRAKELVQQILVFSRMESRIERRPVNLVALVNETLGFLRAALPTTIEIRRDVSAKNLMVSANATQIQQVLTNLCTNAAHAMEETGGVLEVTLTEVDFDPGPAPPRGDIQAGRWVKLTVSDTGRGMDLRTLDRVFDPYFTTKEVGKGTGLGLSVAQGIVKHHEGSISVRSEPGKGATFDVYLPGIEGEASQDVEDEKPLSKGTESILFVDDEAALADIGQSGLELLGYQVVAKTDSVEALELFRSQPERFDLVITDYTMPRMTGVELAEEVMRIRPDIPVILCTGHNERTSEREAKKAGICAFMMKPVSVIHMGETIREVLKTRAP